MVLSRNKIVLRCEDDSFRKLTVSKNTAGIVTLSVRSCLGARWRFDTETVTLTHEDFANALLNLSDVLVPTNDKKKLKVNFSDMWSNYVVLNVNGKDAWFHADKRQVRRLWKFITPGFDKPVSQR
jgi:hypothetical protein